VSSSSASDSTCRQRDVNKLTCRYRNNASAVSKSLSCIDTDTTSRTHTASLPTSSSSMLTTDSRRLAGHNGRELAHDDMVTKKMKVDVDLTEDGFESDVDDAEMMMMVAETTEMQDVTEISRSSNINQPNSRYNNVSLTSGLQSNSRSHDVIQTSSMLPISRSHNMTETSSSTCSSSRLQSNSRYNNVSQTSGLQSNSRSHDVTQTSSMMPISRSHNVTETSSSSSSRLQSNSRYNNLSQTSGLQSNGRSHDVTLTSSMMPISKSHSVTETINSSSCRIQSTDSSQTVHRHVTQGVSHTLSDSGISYSTLSSNSRQSANDDVRGSTGSNMRDVTDKMKHSSSNSVDDGNYYQCGSIFCMFI